MIPLEHGDQGFLKNKAVRFIDTDGITPSPVETCFLSDITVGLQLVMGRGVTHVVHRDPYHLLEQRFIVLPFVR